MPPRPVPLRCAPPRDARTQTAATSRAEAQNAGPPDDGEAPKAGSRSRPIREDQDAPTHAVFALRAATHGRSRACPRADMRRGPTADMPGTDDPPRPRVEGLRPVDSAPRHERGLGQPSRRSGVDRRADIPKRPRLRLGSHPNPQGGGEAQGPSRAPITAKPRGRTAIRESAGRAVTRVPIAAATQREGAREAAAIRDATRLVRKSSASAQTSSSGRCVSLTPQRCGKGQAIARRTQAAATSRGRRTHAVRGIGASRHHATNGSNRPAQ